MNTDTKMFVAGHRGMVGAALLRCRDAAGYTHALTCKRMQLDLLDPRAVGEFLDFHRPGVVFITGRNEGSRTHCLRSSTLTYETRACNRT